MTASIPKTSATKARRHKDHVSLRALRVFVVMLLLVGASAAQEAKVSQAPAKPAATAEDTKPNAAERAAEQPTIGGKVAEESKEAAGEENAQFRQSPSVKWLARVMGIPLGAAYWVFISINFAIVAGFLIFALRKNLPGFFRTRGETIRASLEEARRASTEARTRLTEIEARLGRMDAEIAEMRAAAEREAAAEDERARAAAEEDHRRILAAAEQEIDAAARLARRELKAYAASLAVELAERRIQIDAATDRALVHQFGERFGKDGQ